MCQQKSARIVFEPISAPTSELNSASDVVKSFLISKNKTAQHARIVEKGRNFFVPTKRNFAPPPPQNNSLVAALRSYTHSFALSVDRG